MGTQYKKKGKNNKTKRRKKKGGTPFGIIPVVTYNDGDDRLVEVAVQNKVDNTAYVDRNRVSPVDNDTSSLFDYNNIYDKTISFFTRPDSKISDPLVTRTVKIGINSEKDMEKIAVLNKMIRRYNLLKGVNRRKKGMVGGGDEGNEKDLLNSLNPRETEIAQGLIDRGVFNKLLQTHPQSDASPVENQHAELLRQEQLLNKQLASLKAQPPKVGEISLEKSELPLENRDYNDGSYYIRQSRAAPTAVAAVAPSSSSSTTTSASVAAHSAVAAPYAVAAHSPSSSSTTTSAVAAPPPSTSATTTAVAATPSYPVPPPSTSATTTAVAATPYSPVPPTKQPRRVTSAATTGPSADASAIAKKLEESNKATIATLQSQIGSLKKDIANQTYTKLLDQKMFTEEKNRIKDSLNRDITDLKNSLNNVSQEKANAVSEIQTLKKRVLEKETKLDSLSKEHAEINKTKNALDTEVATLKQDMISNSNESTKKIEALIKDTNTKLLTLNTEMTNKENEFKTLSGLQAVQNKATRDKLLLEKNALTADLLKLNSDKTFFEVEKGEWSRTLDEKEKHIIRLKNESAVKQSQIDNLSQDIASSNAELTTKNNELAVEQARIQQFEIDIAKKTADLLNAQTEFDEVSNELQNARHHWDAERAILSTDQQNKANEIVNLSEQINNLRNSESTLRDVIDDTLYQLKNAKDECNLAIDDLKKTLSNKDIEIGNKDIEIDNLRNQAATTAAASASSALPSATTAAASATPAASSLEQDLSLIDNILVDLDPEKQKAINTFVRRVGLMKNMLEKHGEEPPKYTNYAEIKKELEDTVASQNVLQTELNNKSLSKEERSKKTAELDKVGVEIDELIKAQSASDEYKKEQSAEADERKRTIAPFLKKCYDEMLTFISKDMLKHATQNNMLAMGYSQALTSRFDKYKGCLKLILEDEYTLSKIHFGILNACSYKFCDIVELGALLHILPDNKDPKKQEWKDNVMKQFELLLKNQKDTLNLDDITTARRNIAYKGQVGKIDAFVSAAASAVASLPTSLSSATTLPPTQPSASASASSIPPSSTTASSLPILPSDLAKSTIMPPTPPSAASSSSSANQPRQPPVPIVIGDKVKYTKDSQEYFVTEISGIVKKTYTLCKSYPCDPAETPTDKVVEKDLQKIPKAP
jgi:hypothetical protein